MNTIALFSDRTILPGTHATLTSLLKNNIDESEEMQVILFSDKLKLNDKIKLEQTFNKFKKEHQYFKIEDAPKLKLTGANPLLGNTTTYGRLFLADLLPNIDKLVYLDTDLIIKYDISKFFKLINEDFTLFADGANTRNYSLDKELFKKAKLNMEGKCFNAGVLGINLKKWREVEGFSKCLKVISNFPNQFLSADQAVLNVVFSEDFQALGSDINTNLYPHRKYDITEEDQKIYHFVGSPKPWDFLGSKTHYNYELWKKYYSLSAIGQENHLKYTSLRRLFKSILYLYKKKIKC